MTEEHKAQLLSLRQAASLTPYSAEYLNLLARKGKISAIKIGRDWLITRTDLFNYLMRQQRESKSRLEKISSYLKFLI